jgi:hypothetical protein
MHPWHVIEALYDSEINVGIIMDWDGGARMSVGAGTRRLAERTFLRDEFDEIADWLDDEARRLFPDSLYAQQHRSRDRSAGISASQ